MWKNVFAVPKQTIQDLQRQLRGRFPGAILELGKMTDSGVAEFSLEDPETFPCGGITEVVPARPVAVFSLFFAHLLSREPGATGEVPELALIDGRDSFDPTAFTAGDCAKLLWVRCRTPEESVKAADLILRDGNVPRVILDLSGFPVAEAGRIPASSWHRLRSLVETCRTRLIALCPRPVVPCALLRLTLDADFTLEHLSWPREDLIRRLRASPSLARGCAANGS